MKNEQTQKEAHTLTEIQQCILNILTKVVGILDQHGIRCYMQGGTMLGAVRHGGFIPWDDDADVGVFRRDYEKMLTFLGDALPPELELRTYWDESDHAYYFVRVVDTRYVIRRMGSVEERYENAWVDIFPLDGMPNGLVTRQIHKFRLLKARLEYSVANIRKINIRRPDRRPIEKLIIRFSLKTGYGRQWDVRDRLDRIDALLKKYPVEQSSLVINFMGQLSYRFTEMMPKSWYGEGKQYPFENLMLYGPVEYDKYLTKLYGDYMTPPKECDRNAHVAELVKTPDMDRRGEKSKTEQ